MVVDLEMNALLVAKELVTAAIQPDSVFLESVTETWLDDPPPSLDVVEEQVEAITEVVIEARGECPHEAGEQ